MSEGDVTEFASMQPTGLLLDELARIEVGSLGDFATLDAIVALEKIAAMVHGVQQRFIARFAQLRAGDVYRSDELGATLGITRQSAYSRLDLALQLTERLPATLAALQHGEITLHKAEVITELTSVLSPELAQQVEQAVLARAPRQTIPMLRQAPRRAVARLDPNGINERHQQRRRDRKVELYPAEDGMGWCCAYLPYEQAQAIYELVDRIARDAATPDDERTTDQRRADAFFDLILNPTGDVTPHYEVRVTVPVSTLLGLDELPAELAGYGPIPADIARDIAADARWRRLLTDPVDGTLLDYGRNTYRPPAGLDDHVRARDITCRFPGCRQPAHRCDLDHRIPFPDGPTADTNLNALCRRHHNLKGAGKWGVEPDGVSGLVWTSPAGFRFDVPAESIGEPSR